MPFSVILDEEVVVKKVVKDIHRTRFPGGWRIWLGDDRLCLAMRGGRDRAWSVITEVPEHNIDGLATLYDVYIHILKAKNIGNYSYRRQS